VRMREETKPQAERPNLSPFSLFLLGHIPSVPNLPESFCYILFHKSFFRCPWRWHRHSLPNPRVHRFPHQPIYTAPFPNVPVHHSPDTWCRNS
jgi:hypothetical protein